MSFAVVMTREWRIAMAGRRSQLAEGRNISEEEVERLLAEQGLITVGRAHNANPISTQRFRPIEVSGRPISEMILEERR
jgi:hypothetical protein